MLNNSIVQDARLIHYRVDMHHKWATCPLCHVPGPRAEQVLEHLNKHHLVTKGDQWELHQARGTPPHGMNEFTIAVKRYTVPGPKLSPAQERKGVDEMKKSKVIPPAIVAELERRMRRDKELVMVGDAAYEAEQKKRAEKRRQQGLDKKQIRDIERSKHGLGLDRVIENQRQENKKKKRKKKNR